MLILGINAYHGDVAAVLLRDGELVAAVEEERLSRIKHVAGFPGRAIRTCLDIAGARPSDIDRIAVSRNPRAHLWRKVLFAVQHRPASSLLRERLGNAMAVRSLSDVVAESLELPPRDVASRLEYVEHHAAHLGSTFYPSPFEEAAVCAIDGFGDFVSTSTGYGSGTSLTIDNRVFFPHSLGIVYLAVTQFLGFHHYGDEYKVMGLAPYGDPAFVDRLRSLVHVDEQGSVRLNLSFFNHWRGGMSMTWEGGSPAISQVFTPALEELLGPARRPDEPVVARHEAIAASLQQVYEESAFKVLNALHRRRPVRNLCLAGGCAMNSVANGKIRANTPFSEIYVQPASADNGTALGAACQVWHQSGGRSRFAMRHGYWGPAFDHDAIASAICDRNADVVARGCVVIELADQALYEWTAARIASGDVVGWFQGRMEWGARALGNRSIIADPRRRDMRDIINTRIKFRERFRPFAPSVAVEALDDYFVGAVPDPFMMQVYPVRPDKRDIIPACTHVDGSGRLQTVSRESNERYWRLISVFGEHTGVPVLLNTSFNENEPIVHTPAEALDCFLRTDMDTLVLGNTVLRKRASA